jgi:NAD(P)-dependent dehydrogenase (short-subunit alcohol dehydrogenase family)
MLADLRACQVIERLELRGRGAECGNSCSPLEDTRTEELDRHLAINLRAPFLLARALLPAMRSAGRGMHITLGSVSDHTGFPENAAYAASKFGVRLGEVLAEVSGPVRFSLISRATDTPCGIHDPDARPGFLRAR